MDQLPYPISNKMTWDEFQKLPLKQIEAECHGFGLAMPKIEGEYHLEAYETPDGRGYWTETIDGIRYRCTYHLDIFEEEK